MTEQRSHRCRGPSGLTPADSPSRTDVRGSESSGPASRRGFSCPRETRNYLRSDKNLDLLVEKQTFTGSGFTGRFFFTRYSSGPPRSSLSTARSSPVLPCFGRRPSRERRLGRDTKPDTKHPLGPIGVLLSKGQNRQTGTDRGTADKSDVSGNSRPVLPRR